MSQVIGQVRREVVGCRNWPVMPLPQFIALRRNVLEGVRMGGLGSSGMKSSSTGAVLSSDAGWLVSKPSILPKYFILKTHCLKFNTISAYGHKLNPYRHLRDPLGVEGVRQSVVITNNPSTMDQNQQFLVRFSNFGANYVIVPGTTRLAFTITLTSTDANRNVVQKTWPCDREEDHNQDLRQWSDVYRWLRCIRMLLGPLEDSPGKGKCSLPGNWPIRRPKRQGIRMRLIPNTKLLQKLMISGSTFD